MDKPDKGETLFSVVFVSIVIGEIAVVGAALWRASGWKLLFVVPLRSVTVITTLMIRGLAPVHRVARNLRRDGARPLRRVPQEHRGCAA